MKLAKFAITLSLLLADAYCTQAQSICAQCPPTNVAGAQLCAVGADATKLTRTFASACYLARHNCLTPTQTFIYQRTGPCTTSPNAINATPHQQLPPTSFTFTPVRIPIQNVIGKTNWPYSMPFVHPFYTGLSNNGYASVQWSFPHTGARIGWNGLVPGQGYALQVPGGVPNFFNYFAQSAPWLRYNPASVPGYNPTPVRGNSPALTSRYVLPTTTASVLPSILTPRPTTARTTKTSQRETTKPTTTSTPTTTRSPAITTRPITLIISTTTRSPAITTRSTTTKPNTSIISTTTNAPTTPTTTVMVTDVSNPVTMQPLTTSTSPSTSSTATTLSDPSTTTTVSDITTATTTPISSTTSTVTDTSTHTSTASSSAATASNTPDTTTTIIDIDIPTTTTSDTTTTSSTSTIASTTTTLTATIASTAASTATESSTPNTPSTSISTTTTSSTSNIASTTATPTTTTARTITPATVLPAQLSPTNWQCSSRTLPDGSLQNCVKLGAAGSMTVPPNFTGCGWKVPDFCDAMVQMLVKMFLGTLSPAPVYDAPSAYKLYPGVGYYKVGTSFSTWHEAKAACEADGPRTTLAIPSQLSEYNAVMDIVAQTLPLHKQGFFVGFSEVDSTRIFQSVFGQQPCTMPILRWLPAQPSFNTSLHCVDIGHNSGNGLAQMDCALKLPYVCEQPLPENLLLCRT